MILHLYGDEAGVMPTADHDEMFVAATVALAGKPSPGPKRDGHRGSLVTRLVSERVLGCVSFVRPFPGYGQQLEAKFSRMQTMARATRLLTRANAKYLSRDRFSPRNMVWQHVMKQAIGQTVLSALGRSTVDHLVVVLDQKTMAGSTRTLFADQIRRLADDMRPVLAQRAVSGAPGAVVLYRRLGLARDTVDVRWSDQTLGEGDVDGLFLAHHLASRCLEDLKSGRELELPTALKAAGLPCPEIDVTELLIRAISPDVVREWERRTWLRAPR